MGLWGLPVRNISHNIAGRLRDLIKNQWKKWQVANVRIVVCCLRMQCRTEVQNVDTQGSPGREISCWKRPRSGKSGLSDAERDLC